MKHAYLISAHYNFNQLAYLITLLDDKRNDIFVFIDKKSRENFDEKILKTKFSNVFVMSDFCVNWGGFSITKSYLTMLEKATSVGDYRYFHWLSGDSLPLHSQDYIHTFFEKYDGYEFICSANEQTIIEYNISDRVRFYWLRDLNIHHIQIKRILNYAVVSLQRIVRLDRTRKLKNMKLGFGSNWNSITNDFANYVLAHTDKIEQIFKYSNCSDEVFIQTLALNSKYKDKIFRENVLKNKGASCKQGNVSTLRYIIWTSQGAPMKWTIKNKEELENAHTEGYLFARKFDETVDCDIIRYIGKLVTEEKNFCV